jgi:hypothetical protein
MCMVCWGGDARYDEMSIGCVSLCDLDSKDALMKCGRW